MDFVVWLLIALAVALAVRLVLGEDGPDYDFDDDAGKPGGE